MDAYQILAQKHGYGDSLRYRKILEFLMTPEQAELVVYLPATFEEVAAKTGLTVNKVKREIDQLYRKGVVIPKDFDTLEGARFTRMVLQLHDATEASQLTEKIYGAKASQYWALWEDFCQKEWYAAHAQEYAKFQVPPERVIPAYKAIEDILGITPYDDIREIIKAATLMAVVPCSCRVQARRTDLAINNCLQFGRSAEYAIKRGSGWQVDYTGALRAIDEAEETGEVHMWQNWRTLTYGVMCHCTNDACVNWTPLVQYNVPIAKRAAKSRFEAVVNQELCDGCQTCVDRCQFDAIEMVRPAGSRKYKAAINLGKCYGCGVCVIKCDSQALGLKLVRPLDYIPAERPA